jgi:hypothetical protein
MARAKAKPDDPAQSKRFIDMARELGAEQPGKDYDRLLDRMLPPKRGKRSVVVKEKRKP